MIILNPSFSAGLPQGALAKLKLQRPQPELVNVRSRSAAFEEKTQPESGDKFLKSGSRRMIRLVSSRPQKPLVMLSRPLTSYLDADLKTVNIKQRNTNNCYLLAAIDAMLHSPHAREILESIRVQPMQDVTGKVTQYLVAFPSGRWTVVKADQLGAPQRGKLPVKSSLGIQLLELAYAQIAGAERRAQAGPKKSWWKQLFDKENKPPLKWIEFGNARDALALMFGSGLGAEVVLDAGETGLPILASQIKNKPQSQYLLTAHRKMLTVEHVYSIRHIDPQARTVTVANPWNTKTWVRTHSFKTFGQRFSSVHGFRLEVNRLKTHNLLERA